MTLSPGVEISLPSEAEFNAPILVQVLMVADLPTHLANKGIPDTALDIVMVRRDGPGVGLVSTLDPSAIMLPDEPLPPPPPGTDLENAGFISESRTFDILGFDAEHDGAADYFVFASFAGRLSSLHTLSIIHPSHRLPDSDFPQAPGVPFDTGETPVPPPIAPGVVARLSNGEEMKVDGALRIERSASPFSDTEFPPAFVTVLAVRVDANGGVSGASFTVPAEVDGNEYVGAFSIPLSRLAPELEPGNYFLLVFSGNHQAKHINVVIQ